MNTERAFLRRRRNSGRPWYRHLIYAPKPTYAPEVLPGVAEAMAAGDRKRIDAQVANLVAALDRAAAVLQPTARANSQQAPTPLFSQDSSTQLSIARRNNLST